MINIRKSMNVEEDSFDRPWLVFFELQRQMTTWAFTTLYPFWFSTEMFTSAIFDTLTSIRRLHTNCQVHLNLKLYLNLAFYWWWM